MQKARDCSKSDEYLSKGHSIRTAKTWRQAKCPSTEERIKKVWDMHTMEYYSAIKEKEIRQFAATWTQVEMITLSQVSQRKTNTM